MKIPLISCILPTANRSRFIAQAIRYFHMQDYPDKELIIVYDKAEDLPLCLQESENIRLIKSINKTIGGKRNLACSHAKGKIIIHWDDDDVYGISRISRQVQPIIDGTADFTALTNTTFVELPSFKTWRCTKKLHKEIFYKDVQGGTIAFRKELWNNMGLYPETSLREDADFLKICLDKGAVLQKIDSADLYVYLRHGSYSWGFTAGSFVTKKEWYETELPGLIADNISFYKQIAEDMVTQRSVKVQVPYTAMASCIMPTADRPEFVPNAIACFLNQTYKNKELIILDDGNLPVKHLVPEHPAIRYIRNDKKLSVGTKRNICCQSARGDIIIHWDDDDWYSDDWIEKQVSCIFTQDADICGLSNLLFYAPATDSAWHYVYPGNKKSWVAGATMAYRKNFWKRNPFKNLNVGEDNRFVWGSTGKVVAHNHFRDFVSIIHPGNTSPKYTSDRRWMRIPSVVIMNILKADFLKVRNNQSEVKSNASRNRILQKD